MAVFLCAAKQVMWLWQLCLFCLQIEHAAGCMSDRYGVGKILFADFHCGGGYLPIS